MAMTILNWIHIIVIITVIVFIIDLDSVENYIKNRFKNNKNMKKALKISPELALELYPTADKSFKKLLEENFGVEFFKPKDITEIVHDEKSLAAYLNEYEAKLFIYDRNTTDKHERFINACNIIPKVSKIYNEGTVLGEKEWKNPNVEKYCPYKHFSAGRGSVLFDYWYAGLGCPGGFYVKKRKLAEAHYNNFKKYWEDYWAVKS